MVGNSHLGKTQIMKSLICCAQVRDAFAKAMEYNRERVYAGEWHDPTCILDG